jgi:MarR family transcriptional regulator, transcriptional regulator for hemolysin
MRHGANTEVVSRRPAADEYEAATRLRLALRRFLSRSEQVTRACGLTPQRYQLLLLIRTSGTDATVGGLARALQLSQSNVTQQVRRAEDLGLVRRTLSATDARVRHLTLTDEGARRLARAVEDLRQERELLLAAAADLSDEQG